MDSKLPPGSAVADGRHVLARHRRPGPRHAVGDLLRPAHLARSSASSSTVIALVIGLDAGPRRRVLRRPRRDARSCASSTSSCRFPAILIALILLAVLGQGIGKIIAALVTVQWAYYARTVRGAALVEKRKEYIEAARCLALSPRAHRVPPPAAQLPAAADRGRDGAGGRARSRSRRRCRSSASACRSPSRRSAC